MIIKNILSYQPGAEFTGKEIKEWIEYQIKNKTSHYNEAIHMIKYCNIDDEKYYSIHKGRDMESERHFLIRK